MSTLVKTTADLNTPCILIDVDKAKKNAANMKEICDKLGVNLRPHMKTHKTLEFGEVMTSGTKEGIVVSTLAEAEFYAEGGFEDIIFSKTLTADKLPRVTSLAKKLKQFHFFVDNPVGLKLLEENPLDGDKKWSVFLKVDCGGGRAGVLWDQDFGVELAVSIQKSSAVALRGIYIHEGNSYSAKGEQQIGEIGNSAANKLMVFKNKLSKAGIQCDIAGCGSTPSCSKPGNEMKGVTEFHPGNYIFYDIQQEKIGSCQRKDIAIRLACRVLGHYPHRKQFLVDCGFVALSKDGQGLCDGSYCVFQDHPELRLVKMTQEHGYVEAKGEELDFSKYPIGSLLYIYPYHACATACQHRFFHVISGEKIIDTYKTCCGW